MDQASKMAQSPANRASTTSALLVRRGFWLRSAVLAVSLLSGCGCDIATNLWNSDLDVAYNGDGAGGVERAFAMTSGRERTVAEAKRIAVRATGDPSVTELVVNEAHYGRETADVVYTGQIVFRCRATERLCRQVHRKPTSGTSARNIFFQWPSTIDPPRPAGARAR